jgi:hypothetical protein
MLAEGALENWLIAIAAGAFVVFLLARFNRHRLGALSARWEKAPRYWHDLIWAAYAALFAWLWMSRINVDPYLPWAWVALSVMSFVMAIYHFITRNKPIDNSRRAVRRRAMRSLVWSMVLVTPLVWMLVQRAIGAETAGWPWGFAAGAAMAGIFVFLYEIRRLTTPEAEET